MSDEQSKDNWRYKTMRHMEAVRNHVLVVVGELLHRCVEHDQKKLEHPEAPYYEEHTPKLRGVTYGSEEYKAITREMRPAIQHHYNAYRHHPEHFEGGISDMTLVDLVEMLCDWQTSSLRHGNGDIFKSIEINQKRFGYSDDLKHVLRNTAIWLKRCHVKHKAEES